MAVVYDNTSTRTLTTGDQSWSHAGSASAAGALVLIVEEGGTDTIIGVTYGGETMVEVTGSPLHYTTPETGSIHAFFLADPPKGTQTVAVDTDTGSDQWIAACFTVTSATGNSQVHDTSIQAGATGQTTVGATLTISVDSFVAGAMYSGLGAPAFTEVSGTVEVVEGDLGQDSGGISRGNSIKTANFAYTWTQASDDGMALVVAICEAAAALSIAPSAIAGAEAFGTAILSSSAAVVPTGISEPSGGAIYAGTIIDDGPLSYWRMGEVSGAIQDEIGTNHSTSTGGTPTYGVTGLITGDNDTAIQFPTSTAFTISSSGWPTGAGARSLEIWFSSSDASIGDIVGYGSNTGAYNLWYMRITSTGQLQLLTRDSAGTGYVATAFGGTGLRDGNTHHAVITYDGTTARGYIDGSQVGTDVAITSNVTTGIAYIGVWSGYWVGVLDEVAVYDYQLTGTQISAHYTAGTTTASTPIGSPTVILGEAPVADTISPSAISSVEAFGTATLLPGAVNVSATEVVSAEAFGTATILRGNWNLVATAITSAEAFGTATLLRGGVTIAPSAITSTQAFGTATILRGSVTITVTAIASAQALGTPTLQATAIIIASGITSAEAFGTASVVCGNVTIVLTGIASAEAFGTAFVGTIAPPLDINPTAIASSEAFGIAVLRTTATILANAIASSEAFSTAIVARGTVRILPTGIDSAQVFGTGTVLRGSVTIQVSQIASIEAFGTATVNLGVTAYTLYPNAIASSEAFGTATLLRGGVLVLPTGIASAAAISSPLVSASAKILPTGIASVQVFGTPTLVVGGVSIRPSGIASAGAFGTTFVSTGGSVIQPIGITSAETFGTVTLVAGGRTVVVTGIATAQAFGTPVLLKTATITVSGIASIGTYGVPVVIRGAVSIVPTGATTGEALGTPTIVSGAGVVLPVPIGSAEIFGNTTVQISAIPGQTVEPSSAITAEVFGNATVLAGMVRAIVTGIGTAEVVPNPVLYGHNDLAVIGITSAELFGLPVVAKGSAYIRPGGLESGEVVPNPALANLLDSWRWVNNAPALIGTRPGGFPVLQSGLYDTTRQEGEG